ncbi:MAG: BMP family ABC transporter substrate-binding protein [Muribaculaceae bacterium]|nr:BMP family ABC transporter substrate-binding protein [Roseburia sp.]MCM1430572.1 BMP family ABC transporter substrate-binding protein [Muribaculaceae bacterium]MCM1492679.1 BMP family ABC transporter substrate-binding protein [Muribaculaceae bacterium]
MGELEYSEALKLGKREYKACVVGGRFPYLPVLDDILSREEIQTEQNMGLIQIPLEFVVGTTTMGRTFSFAANFMPILGEKTEFAIKWANLSDAQMNEGIRDPIKAYEYRNRYYVLEGNKRVSVLKYFKADSIMANVTRKLPKYSEDEDIRLYYEYVKFNALTGVNNVEFSKLGMAEKLIGLMGDIREWDDIVRQDFTSLILHFSKAYHFRGGKKLPIRVGDAFTAFVNVYGYEAVAKMTDAELNANIIKCWNEFVMLCEKKSVGLVMDPKEVQKKNLFSYFLPVSSKKLTAAFLYPKSPEDSDWIYAHELGRSYLEETFPDQIETLCVTDVREDNIETVLTDVMRQGADIIFEIGPQMMPQSLKIAVDHPDVKILNCSLNTPHKYIRTYYARMYEAKFLSGMIAGALAENDRIAYIADYPIYGMIANINAFALGATFTNPRAQIYLEWSTKKGYDRDRFLMEHDIHIVSDQDMITPQDASRHFGLYRYENGEIEKLVMPLWNWGIFYEKMIQSILAGAYQTEENDEGRALNYWWGMSAGVIDLICSKNVPAGVKRLAEHFKEDIKKGDVAPFYSEIRAQDGTIKNQKHQTMSPEDIMEMDYLVDNVQGSIPEMEILTEAAKTVVQLKGVEENK